jgi:hypothetical protein
MAGKYTAQIVDVPGEGIRLEPAAGASIPEQPNDINLLAIALAFALGTAGYEHHPRPRNPEAQTLEGLLAGTLTMPWRPGPAAGGPGTSRYIICEQGASGHFQCAVRGQPGGTAPGDPAPS